VVLLAWIETKRLEEVLQWAQTRERCTNDQARGGVGVEEGRGGITTITTTGIAADEIGVVAGGEVALVGVSVRTKGRRKRPASGSGNCPSAARC